MKTHGLHTAGLKKRRRWYLLGAYVILILNFAALIILWLAESPLFRIDKVVVEGNASVTEANVVDLLKSRIAGKSFLASIIGFNDMLTWPGGMSSADLTMIPEIKSIAITKGYENHQVTVAVEERTPVGIWCSNPLPRTSAFDPHESASECWWFDNVGFIFKRAMAIEGSFIETVQDVSQRKLGLNIKILPDEFITPAISILDLLKTSGINAKEINLVDLSLHELDVITYDGPKLYFSLDFSADRGIAEVFQKLQAQPNFKNLAYIDFRVQNKVYYK